MIQSTDIDAIIGADVVDSADDRIGKVSQVYVDSRDQHPSWIAVKTGLFGSADTLVPIEDAAWDSGRLRVGVSKATVRDAPHVDPDREITVDEQNRLYRHYGIDAASTPASIDQAVDADGARDAGAPSGPVPPAAAPLDQAAADEARSRRRSSDGASVDGSDGVPVATGPEAQDPADRGPAHRAPLGAAGGDEAPAESSAAPGIRGDAARRPDAPTADAVRDSEPTSTPPVAGFRMRLRKVTVTEQRTVTFTLPVSHEEIRLERVPDDEPDGPDVIRGVADVVLMAERPIVSTERIAVERVHVALDPIQQPTAP